MHSLDENPPSRSRERQSGERSSAVRWLCAIPIALGALVMGSLVAGFYLDLSGGPAIGLLIAALCLLVAVASVTVTRIACVRDKVRYFADESSSRSIMESVLADSPSFDEALRGCVSTVCRRMEWPAGTVHHVDERTGEVESLLVYWSVAFRASLETAEDKETAQPTTTTDLATQVLASGVPAWEEDLSVETTGSSAVRGALAIPVSAEGRTVAVLEFVTADVLKPDSHLLDLLTNISRQLGRAFERKRSEAEMMRLSCFPSENPQPVFELRRDGTVT